MDPAPPPENSLEPEGLKTGVIELINALLVAAVALGFYLAGTREGAVGVLAGGALSGASFRTVAVVMKRIITPAKTGFWPVAVFWLKYMAVIAVVGWLILKVKLDVMGFLVGVTLIVPSILIEAFRSGRAREEQGK